MATPVKAKCIEPCFHGPTSWSYKPDGGENGDGYYMIDPDDPIAKYFEFPKAIQETVDARVQVESEEKDKRLVAFKKKMKK